MPEAKSLTGSCELSSAVAEDVTMASTDAKDTESDKSQNDFFTVAQSAPVAEHCQLLSDLDIKPELLQKPYLSEPSAAVGAMEREAKPPRLSPLITDTSAIHLADCHGQPSDISQSGDPLTLDQLEDDDDVNEEEFHDASQG